MHKAGDFVMWWGEWSIVFAFVRKWTDRPLSQGQIGTGKVSKAICQYLGCGHNCQEKKGKGNEKEKISYRVKRDKCGATWYTGTYKPECVYMCMSVHTCLHVYQDLNYTGKKIEE